jgi:transcriptional regulator with XRE-family HTH domain
LIKIAIIATFVAMDIGENIKNIREQKGMLQKEATSHLNLDKSAYSKLEKGTREIKVTELLKLSELFNMSLDQIVNFEGDTPQEITIEDKAASEQLKLISQLDDDDKQTVFNIIDKMLTNKKFKTFFKENIKQ